MKVTFESDDERCAAGAIRALLAGLERNGHHEQVLAHLTPADRAAVDLAAAAIGHDIATREVSAES